MKKIILGLSILSALFVASCKKVEYQSDTTNTVDRDNYKISANVGTDTKVTIDGIVVTWNEDDVIYMGEIESGAYTRCLTFLIDPESISEDGKSADFYGETTEDYLIDGNSYAPVTGWLAMIYEGAFEVYPYEGAKESSVTNFSDWFMTSSLFEANSEDGLVDLSFEHRQSLLSLDIEFDIPTTEEWYIYQVKIESTSQGFQDYFSLDTEGNLIPIFYDDPSEGTYCWHGVTGDTYLNSDDGCTINIPITWDETITDPEGDFVVTLYTRHNLLAYTSESSVTIPARSFEAGKIYTKELTFETPIIDLTTSMLFATLQHNLAYYMYDEWQNLRQWGAVSQCFSQVNYSDEDRYQFRTSVLSNYYDYIYSAVKVADKIETSLTDSGSEVAADGFGDIDMLSATATILRCWAIMNMCQTTGDTPYSEATLSTPKYDAQIDIFKGVIEELKEAYDVLKDNPTGWSEGDRIYGGDALKWAKFANSLRLQFALRLSNYDPTYSSQEAASAISDGVFTSNSDNAIYRFTDATTDPHPMYESIFVDGRDDYSMCQSLANLMKGENDYRSDYVNIFEGISDPRFDTYIGPYSVQNGFVNGQPYGLETATNMMYRNSDTYTIVYRALDYDKAVIYDYDFWSTFMDYANVCFLQAELNGNDKTLYLAGVEASLDQWSGEDTYLSSNWATLRSEYLSTISAEFDAASSEEKLEMIITQKYIHNFAHFNQEGWFEYNRTGYPKSFVEPGDQVTTYDGIDYYFIPLEGDGEHVANRLPYSPDEAEANGTNQDAAIANIGGNSVNTPLIWQKRY